MFGCPKIELTNIKQKCRCPGFDQTIIKIYWDTQDLIEHISDDLIEQIFE